MEKGKTVSKKRLTEHFTCEEMASPDTGACDMDSDFMRDLEALRIRCGFVFIPTSGYRTQEHNEHVGGADHGMHPKGSACDISHARWTGVMRHKFITEASAMGFSIGIYQAHFHIDRRKSPTVLWIASSKG